MPLKDSGVAVDIQPEMKDFLDRYNLPRFQVVGDYSEEQVQGEDPLLVIEKIVSDRGRGKKKQYRIKWEGSATQTWEPAAHLDKYGAAVLETWPRSMR